MLGHFDASEKKMLTLTWQAPPKNVGAIVFVASFVQSYEVYWYEVTSQVMRATPSNVPADVGEFSTVTTSLFPTIGLDNCGKSKGCFLWPNHCSGNDCLAAVTHIKIGNQMHFEMKARAEGYVSVGFSDDTLMGDDDVVACMAHGDQVTVQHGYNHPEYNERQYRGALSNLSTQHVDGNILCRFTRPMSMDALVSDHTTKPTSWNKKTFDLNNDWYIMLAWGMTIEDSEVMAHHDALPPVSRTKIDLNQNSVYRGNSLHMVLQAHAILGILAWMLFTGMSTVIARHYKHAYSDKKLFGTKVWFQAHRALAVLTGIFSLTCFVMMFIWIGQISTASPYHAYTAIALIIVMTLQILGGVLRPGPDSGIRPYFNWGHRLLGKSSHILSAVCILLGFLGKVIPVGMRDMGLIVTVIWICMHVGWELVFEIYWWYQNRKPDEDSKTKYTMTIDEDSKGTKENIGAVLFVLYLVTILTLTIACLVPLFLF